MSLIQRGYGLLRQNLQRLARFGVVGMIGLIADVGLFNLLTYAGGEGPLYHQAVTAKAISTSLGIVVSWLGHRYWTFSEKRRTAAHREFVVFLVVCLIGLAITVGTLAISRHVLGFSGFIADNLAANVIGLGLATAFRFWAMNTHVFTEVRPPATDDALVTSGR